MRPLALLLGALALAALSAGEPRTAASREQELTAWRNEAVLKPLRARLAGQPQAAELIAFAEDRLRLLATAPAVADQAAFTAQRDRLEALLAGGCRDPLAILWRIESQEPSRDPVHFRTRAERLALAWDGRAALGAHHRYRLALLRMQPGAALGPMDAPALQAASADLAEAAWAMLTDRTGPARAREEHAVELFTLPRLEHEFRDRIEQPSHQRLLDRLARQPQAVSPWLARMISGKIRIGLAWQARGGGLGKDVTAEGHAAFQEHLVEARTQLEADWTADPTRPAACAALITVGMGLRDLDRTWYERGMQAMIDHDDLHRAWILANAPRWGGTFPGLIAEGRAAAASRRYDTGLPWQLVNALIQIRSDQVMRRDEDMALFRADGLWRDLAAMFAGYERAAKPWPRWHAPTASSAMTVLAHVCGQDGIARAEFAKLGGQVDPWWCWRFGTTPERLAKDLAQADVP